MLLYPRAVATVLLSRNRNATSNSYLVFCPRPKHFFHELVQQRLHARAARKPTSCAGDPRPKETVGEKES